MVRAWSSSCCETTPCFDICSARLKVTCAFSSSACAAICCASRRGEVRFGLSNLIADLPFLVAQGRGALRHLRGCAFGARRVKRLLLLQLTRIEDRQQLVLSSI